MTDNINIPPEAIEAAAINLHRLVYDEPDSYSWAETDEGTRTHFRTIARAACLAMLRAWPRMDTGPNIYGRQNAIIRLPLPQENTND